MTETSPLLYGRRMTAIPRRTQPFEWGFQPLQGTSSHWGGPSCERLPLIRRVSSTKHSSVRETPSWEGFLWMERSSFQRGFHENGLTSMHPSICWTHSSTVTTSSFDSKVAKIHLALRTSYLASLACFAGYLGGGRIGCLNDTHKHKSFPSRAGLKVWTN